MEVLTKMRGCDGIVPSVLKSNLCIGECIHFQLAREIGNRDREFVLKARKLVLLVDLDQTLIHSTSCPFSGDNVSVCFTFCMNNNFLFKCFK